MTDATAADMTAATPPTLVQKLTAEAVGTFVLVVIGCGAAVMTGADVAATGLAFGIAIVMMAYAFGRISGGHFNPAVSVGAALAGRISWANAGLYIAAQFVGGLVGALVLWVLLHGFEGYESSRDGIGANLFGDQGSGYEWWAAFLLEVVLTAIFVLVILAVTDERNDTVAFAPLAIGLALAAIHFVGIPATGTSVNPARSLGPGIFTFDGDQIVQQWLFIVAPLVGAAVVGFLYPMLFGRGADPVPGSGLGGGRRVAAGVPGLGAPNAFEQQWNQQDYAQPGAQAGAAQEQPIIQDGWQWDPASQQWIPAQQQPAPPQAPGQQGWAPPAGGGDQTQVRPPQ